MRNEVTEGNVKSYCEELEKRLENLQDLNARLQGKLAKNLDESRNYETSQQEMKRELQTHKDENTRLKKQLEKL